ncbi:hypothetical protein H257_13228 [Aphanomyces astaci]|uniref:Serine protease n=1 Tax=Aphanomyces astaci TaxID=112090 RepID=W4FVS0_APHAT|nr:hypothetical protein H257_13228 [Aphanomyces astaci]ETV71562.1 hypothetical protein H257_13228 [Aphanomyces astaci]RQM20876.1 hypothetical protein B5M09_004493 [Aphanomyces astaci]|eukprot:XP_009838995.1 hypothetical protein H257_13228 [Aphanomyces astaci]
MFSFLQLVITVAVSAAAVAASSLPLIGSDHSVDTSFTSLANTPLTRTISDPNAIYVAPHFAYVRIPSGGVLTVSAADGSQAVNYTGHHKNFYAEYVHGPSAVITYTPPATTSSSDHPAFVVDRYVSGSGNIATTESICSTDNTKGAPCLKDSDSPKYKKAQAVARLLIGGSGLCTGWLFGSEGHLITNNHCIVDAEAATNVQVEFGAECATCDDPNNSQQFGCKGEVVATSVEFLRTNKTLDYTLVKLKLKDGASLTKYGYLQARASKPALNDPIYVVHHPRFKPSCISTVLDNGDMGKIEKLSVNKCQRDLVGYSLDTDGGSSGAPVLCAKENSVVALHNCGGCMNGAIKMYKIVDELKSLGLLPADAISSGGDDDPSPPMTTTPHSPSTTSPSPSTTFPPMTTMSPSPSTTFPPMTTTSPSPSTKKPSTTSKSPAPTTKSPSTSHRPVPTTTRPRKTCKRKTKKPSRSHPTQPPPSIAQHPPAKL